MYNSNLTIFLDDPETQHTPIIKLAIRVLSICPNSASCERLFSTFGLILTKLRSRLKKTTLLDLAELKMHIQDEYIRNDIKTSVRERQFGTQSQNTQQTPDATPENPAADINSPVDNVDSLDVPMVDVEVPDNSINSTHSSANSSTRALRQLTVNLTRLTTEDSLDDEDEDEEVSHDKHNIRLQDLFDFSSDYWSTVDQRSAVASLEAEMSFYELLDLDAVGEPDLDPDLDDAVASLFNM